MIRNLIVLITFFTVGLSSFAQDPHFSQFWNTPLLQNPSFAGKADGDIRAIVNHKSQWGAVTSNPYQTFGASYDMLINSSSSENKLAGGLSMYTDVAGASKMRTTLVNLAAAYHFKVSTNHFLSGGVQFGINQKSIDDSDLRFDNQFEGTGHNAALSSNESFGNFSEIKPTVAGGISYLWIDQQSKTTGRGSDRKINVGVAMHHLNSPDFMFISEEAQGFRYIGSFLSSFTLDGTNWTIQPAAFAAIQNNATDIVMGSVFQYQLKEASRVTDFNKSASIGLGGFYRFGDAIIPNIQFQWSTFSVGMSYDINVSQLSGASFGRGGFEINLKFVSLNSSFGKKSQARFM